MAAGKEVFRILAFGDSLTEGWCHFGLKFHPYTSRLKELLRSSSNRACELINKGRSGETTDEMVSRLARVLSTEGPFHLAIILGGTNDLGQSWETANPLFERLKSLHETVLEHGATSVAVTIPETGYEEMEQYAFAKKKRNKINELLGTYAADSNGKVVLCDFAAKFPRHSLKPDELERLWNDGLHLTPAGYDRMAEIIYEVIRHLYSSAK